MSTDVKQGSKPAEPTPIEGYLMASESKSVKVLLWMLNNRDKDNVIHGTLDSIAASCSVTKVTVNRVFQRLYKQDYLVKLRNSRYQLKKV